MAKIKDPVRFSEHFGISKTLLKRRGAFDPVVNADTPLFIDPFLLEESKHPEMQAAYGDWETHFTNLIKLLSASQAKGDAAWKAADKMLGVQEFKGTCLGYGAGIAGNAIGKGPIRARLLKTAKEIVDLGVNDPAIFPLLALFEDDVGPDRISDLTTRVIGPRLGEFTERVLKGLQIPRQKFDISGQSFLLPVNPKVNDRGGRPLPVVLVPNDVLRDLPIATDWDDIERVTWENEQLRKRVNAAVGDLWGRQSRESKQNNRAAYLHDRDAFDALLAAIHAIPKQAYDEAGDPSGLIKWLETGRAIAAALPLALKLKARTPAGVKDVVEQIVEHFKHIIEDRDVWKSLYGPNGAVLHEHYAQRLFLVTSLSYCKANNVDISPETNPGGGPVDFKLSQGFADKVVVEMKLSSNPKLDHGYTKQLERYKRGEATSQGYYVIIHVGVGQRQVDLVLKREIAARKEKQPYSPVIVIDGTKKRSASKL
ncbi:MAG TPA: hypothetical protein VJQ52_18700 [Steroidobacteraceae bacterium]|nr:hypothetical protein [Steroidobacteraceae bacterium]